MLIQSISGIFERELLKLSEEIKLYSPDELLWKIQGDIKNSGGNLCLHITGNLQHFVGHVMGNTGYIRNRDHEFTAKDISKSELLLEIENATKSIKTTLANITDEELNKEYTAFPAHLLGKEKLTTGYFLVHLVAHLDYHLGQINYHRRMIS